VQFDNNTVVMNTTGNESKNALLSAEELLREIFPDDNKRPSVRWLRELQAKRRIPFRKIGRFVFFDPTEVRSALDKGFTVNPD